MSHGDTELQLWPRTNRALQVAATELGRDPSPCLHRPLLLGCLRSPKLPPSVGCSLQSLGPHGTLGPCLLASLSCPGHRLSRVTQVCSSQEKKPSHLTSCDRERQAQLTALSPSPATSDVLELRNKLPQTSVPNPKSTEQTVVFATSSGSGPGAGPGRTVHLCPLFWGPQVALQSCNNKIITHCPRQCIHEALS